MARALVVLSPGFEEIEAVTIIDLLRRGGIQVAICGLTEGSVTGSHDITIGCDVYYETVNPDAYDILILPGGQPGTNHLKANPQILDWVKDRFERGRKLAAICAAPTVFHAAGITKNMKLTSYPSEKTLFTESDYREEKIVRDGHVITSRGVGTAIDFALALVEELTDTANAEKIKKSILHDAN